jgi:hypothetical protein
MLAGLACAVAVCGPALAQAQAPKAGTAPEARAMLKHAVRALRADKQKALTAFSRGTDGFNQRDLYVFCFGPDGKLDAHPNPARALKSGPRLLATHLDGGLTEAHRIIPAVIRGSVD